MRAQLSTIDAIGQHYIADWLLDLQVEEERSLGDAGDLVWPAVKDYFVRQMYRQN